MRRISQIKQSSMLFKNVGLSIPYGGFEPRSSRVLADVFAIYRYVNEDPPVQPKNQLSFHRTSARDPKDLKRPKRAPIN